MRLPPTSGCSQRYSSLRQGMAAWNCSGVFPFVSDQWHAGLLDPSIVEQDDVSTHGFFETSLRITLICCRLYVPPAEIANRVNCLSDYSASLRAPISMAQNITHGVLLRKKLCADTHLQPLFHVLTYDVRHGLLSLMCFGFIISILHSSHVHRHCCFRSVFHRLDQLQYLKCVILKGVADQLAC